MNCDYCQEEFEAFEEVLQVRLGVVEISSRSLGPSFIPDEEDWSLVHKHCLAKHCCPDEEEVRAELRKETVEKVGEMFQESFNYEREEEIPRVEVAPTPRGGRNRFRTRRRLNDR